MKLHFIHTLHLLTVTLIYGKSPLKVATDHSGNTSDISTDELVLHFDDGSSEKLTNNGCMERVPVLSHNGSHIVFLRRFDSNVDGLTDWDDEVELWLMTLGSRAESRIAPQLTNPSQATWHPKKMIFAFIADEKGKGRGLYIHDLDKGTTNRLADEADSWPTWSSGGGFIAFYDEDNKVVIFDPAKGVRKDLSEDVGNGWALYWTEDNRLVFTVEGAGWQIYSPGAKNPKLLSAKAHKKLTFVDQEKFGWSTK